MFFESVAYAMGGAPGGAEQGNPIMSMLPLILMFVIFYFLLIRPQQKKAKEHKQTLSSLKKGDFIIVSGIYGRIMEVSDEVLSVDVGNGNLINVNRNFVSGLAEKPSMPKEQRGKKSKAKAVEAPAEPAKESADKAAEDDAS
ncbi:preprotein translocase subunit YajC [Desulfovibrio inopinatus]|uniref:preprotein translocase subunit YajC n=1 Tax=Desulfovibrio inopinatus TaxID=102109 RepID=UPI000401978F|nr:preprotein translocase subunit YajC [Desulfovibrio inopinatus]